jgi:MobA/MobL family
MAIYHLSATVVQRSKGHSAVAGAAYRSGTVLHETRTMQTHDYQRKRGIVQSGILAPDNAPQWVYDREALWNRAEAAERQHNGQPAREIRLGLPHELTDEQRADLVFTYAQDMFVDSGMVADISIHRPDRHGDQRNHHAHILLTMRELDGDNFATRKNRDWNRTETLEHWREQWEEYQNRALEDAESDARVDHRSLEAQGIELHATIHLGKAASAMERKGISTERGDLNREALESNRRIEQLTREIAEMEAEIASELERELSEPELEIDHSSFPTGQAELQPELALSWEKQKAQLQNPANWRGSKAFEQQLVVCEPESSFSFLADREPAQDAQSQLTWEEEKEQLQNPANSDVGKAFKNQIREQGKMKEYGLGKSWFHRTAAYVEQVYDETAAFIKDTWQEYLTGRSGERSDPDKHDPGWGR